MNGERFQRIEPVYENTQDVITETIPVTVTDNNGNKVGLDLTRDEAETLATSLFRQLSLSRSDGNKAILKQDPFMTLSDPAFEFGWKDGGDIVIGIGLHDMRPIFIKLRREHAVVISSLFVNALAQDAGPASIELN